MGTWVLTFFTYFKRPRETTPVSKCMFRQIKLNSMVFGGSSPPIPPVRSCTMVSMGKKLCRNPLLLPITTVIAQRQIYIHWLSLLPLWKRERESRDICLQVAYTDVSTVYFHYSLMDWFRFYWCIWRPFVHMCDSCPLVPVLKYCLQASWRFVIAVLTQGATTWSSPPPPTHTHSLARIKQCFKTLDPIL